MNSISLHVGSKMSLLILFSCCLIWYPSTSFLAVPLNKPSLIILHSLTTTVHPSQDLVCEQIFEYTDSSTLPTGNFEIEISFLNPCICWSNLSPKQFPVSPI